MLPYFRMTANTIGFRLQPDDEIECCLADSSALAGSHVEEHQVGRRRQGFK